MMQLWSVAMYGVALGVLSFGLYEMSGYFSFRDTYYAHVDRSLRVYSDAVDLRTVANALRADFEVRCRTDAVLVRPRHGIFSRSTLAHARVFAVDDGYLVQSGAGPRAFGGWFSAVIPCFSVGLLCGGQVALGVALAVVGALLFLAYRSFLVGIARRFGEEISVHI